MKTTQPRAIPLPTPDEAAREYLFDMLDQMAKLARQTGEIYVAIHLEALMESSRELTKRRSA